MKHFLPFVGMIVGIVLFAVLFSISPTVQSIFAVTVFISSIAVAIRESFIIYRKYRLQKTKKG